MKRKLSIFLVLVMVMTMCFSAIAVSAADAPTALWEAVKAGGYAINKETVAYNAGGAAAGVAKESIVKTDEPFYYEQGGTTTYADLIGAGTPDEVSEEKYKKLKNSEQTRFVSLVLTILETEVAFADNNGHNAQDIGDPVFTAKNAEDIRAKLTTKLGVGTATVSAIMHNINPDFQTANKIAGPFLNVFNIFLGVVGILLMAFFFLTMLLDLTYIAIPAFREMLVKGKGSTTGDKGVASKLGSLVSDEAQKAVSDAEGDRGAGNSAWNYIKRKWISLLLFLILLVALVSGRMMSLASSIINLVSGFFD